MADHETIRVLVVDDEPAARRGVRSVLDGWSADVVVEECRNGGEAVRAIPTFDPHVVLLDVQMPGLDGFDVIREVGADRMPAVVFVTAYDEHALRAFDVAAVDYVVKPFTDERLRQAMDRALKRRSERRAVEVQRQLLALLEGAGHRAGGESSPTAGEPTPFRTQASAEAPAYLTRLLVSVGTRSEVVPVSTVSWIRADDYYASVFAGGTAYVIRESLAELERRLDPREFMRVHRSAIVRLGMVRSLERPANGRYSVVLRDGTRVPVSRSRYTVVARTLGDLRG
ncbi:MAG TPA: LytTR family DNA-binding domain-containing protein [Gemmatimonadaceae bacterium]|nr:LytTR family DNA-binding domain-containing protein [Gemmatimonadaceae bacterium]